MPGETQNSAMTEPKRKKHPPPITPNNDPELNPCLEESIQSMECLNRNQDNRDRCELFFENYRMCRKFWSRVVRERKAQGISPELPPMEERIKVLKEHNMK